MITGEAQSTVRNAFFLVAQRGVYVAGGLVTAALVPRLMGPAFYGRYALVTSLASWFVIASGWGVLQVLGRYLPQLAAQGDEAGIRRLFGGVLSVRLVGGVLAAAAYLLFTTLAFHGLGPATLAIAAAVVLTQSAAVALFAVNLGLNRAARWGMGDTLRRLAALLGVTAGFVVGGLRGACLGLLLAELAVIAVGLVWARPYLSRQALRLDWAYLMPYLRFGLPFFASTLLISAFQHSGEAIVQAASGDYAQVGFFGLAFNVYLAAAGAIPQFTLAFIPLIGRLQSQGRLDELKAWVGHLLKWLAIAGVVAAYGALFLAADVVPPLFGPAYRPVASCLVPLALALVAVGPGSAANLLALACDRPRIAAGAAALELGAFWAVGVPLATRLGGLGACLAVLIAASISAAYATVRLRAVVRYPLRDWGLAVGLSMPFVPLIALRGPWPVQAACFVVAVCGYAGLLVATRTITARECTSLWRTVMGHGPVAAPVEPGWQPLH